MYDVTDETKQQLLEETKNLLSFTAERILKEYEKYLPEEKKEILQNFIDKKSVKLGIRDYHSPVLEPGPGRAKNGEVILTPDSYHKYVQKEVQAILYDEKWKTYISSINLEELENKIINSDIMSVTEAEVGAYRHLKQMSLNEMIESIAIHEMFHTIIGIKDKNRQRVGSYTINNEEEKIVVPFGRMIDEGMVDYYTRKFCCNKKYRDEYRKLYGKELPFIPSGKYEAGIKVARPMDQLLGLDKTLIFNGNCTEILRRINHPGLTKAAEEIEKKDFEELVEMYHMKALRGDNEKIVEEEIEYSRRR